MGGEARAKAKGEGGRIGCIGLAADRRKPLLRIDYEVVAWMKDNGTQPETMVTCVLMVWRKGYE